MSFKKTRQEFIADLDNLQTKVSAMGERASQAVEKSMRALVKGDKLLAHEVMREDDVIDDMIIGIEDDCILLIAKQQPIAHDLRVIATGFKISTDIERIGDHAFDIAKTTCDLETPLEGKCLSSVQELADCAERMVQKAMQAYRARDVQLADEVRHMDAEMDKVFARTFYVLSDYVKQSSDDNNHVTQLLFVARFLERIGDHAVNIAEWVIYLETAERIHSKKHAE